jgi:hypothetical protein
MSGREPGPVLLTRPGCHLCDDFHAQWRAAFPGVDLPRLNVDSDADLVALYGLRIPVLLDAEGALVCELHFDHAACLEMLRTS